MVPNSLILKIEPQVQTYLAYLTARPYGEEIEYRTSLENLFSTLQVPFMSETFIVQEDRHSGLEIAGMSDLLFGTITKTLNNEQNL